MSQRLQRLSDTTYAIVDSELVLICASAGCMADPKIIGLAFKTRSAGWRCLRQARVDIGYRPDEQTAIKRMIEDAASLPPRPQAEPFVGCDEARKTLKAGGDIGHRTCMHLLQLSIDIIDALLERRHGLPPAVGCGREARP